jgi:hypothetical protein
MRRPARLLLAAAIGYAAFSAVASFGLPPVQTKATPTAYPASVKPARYPVFDAHGRQSSAPWHWTAAGGNCCEVYVSTTAKGRILEFGGSYPFYSDNAGRTWQQINYVTPLYNGEGALVAGPNGDVYGVGWDMYTGDHLQAVRYSAKSKSWDVAEMPLKESFYDRAWISYAKGPFTIGGQKYPYATIVRGGGIEKSVELISGDGLAYYTISRPAADTADSEPTGYRIPVVRNPAADYWQPDAGTFTVPLTGGGVLRLKAPSDYGTDEMGCPAARLDQKTATWRCVKLPWETHPREVLRQDSRGWLTEAYTESPDAITLRLSPDGGRHWRELDLADPKGRRITSSDVDAGFFDVKVNGRLKQAVVATRVVNGAGLGQDLVWRLDISKPQPRLLKTYYVGKGDAETTVGLIGALENRYDFPSVALLPSGRIVASFVDSGTPRHLVRDVVPAVDPTRRSPALAVLD